MDEHDAVRGEEKTRPQADGSRAQTMEVFVGFPGHRKEVREDEGGLLVEIGIADIRPFPLQIVELLRLALLEKSFEPPFGDGDPKEGRFRRIRVEAHAFLECAANRLGDVSFIESLQRSEVATVEGDGFRGVRRPIEYRMDRGVVSNMVREKKSVRNTVRDNFEVSGCRKIVQTEIRGCRTLTCP